MKELFVELIHLFCGKNMVGKIGNLLAISTSLILTKSHFH